LPPQVTIASVLGLVGACQVSDYCGSKAALFSLHESLRYELDKRYDAPNVRTTLAVLGHIDTPMFSRVNWPRSRFWRFLIPTLQPVTVVKAIIQTLDDQHSRVIHLPFYTNFIVFVRALPSFLRDAAQWVRPVNPLLCFTASGLMRPSS
jgi:short-subunit dehydrogenase